MFNSSAHSPAQRFPTDNNAKTKTPVKYKTKHTTVHTSMNKKQEMGNIHIHFPTNTQGEKHIQKTQTVA